MNWGDKPWHSFDFAMKAQFGVKMIRLSLDRGATCPNRDGTLGKEGCLFCSSEAQQFDHNSRTLGEQIQIQKFKMHKKWPQGKFIAYFNTFSNTYGDLNLMSRQFEEAIEDPEILGLAIGTRPDCINPPVLSHLKALQKKTTMWVEFGLQTAHNQTAASFGRGYDYSVFQQAAEQLKASDIPVVAHLINGLPGETAEMMIESVHQVVQAGVAGVKLQLLHILKGTAYEEMYLRGEIPLMEKEQYIQLVCDQLEVLPPEVVVHRLTGDGDGRWLVAPLWSKDKKTVLNGIYKEMRHRNSWQGKRL